MAAKIGRRSKISSSVNEIIRNDIKNGDALKINSKEKLGVNLLEHMKELLDTNVLCDVVLVAADDGSRIPAHRIVLTSSSKYFRAMLSSGMLETQSKEIALKNISSEALRLIIDYCYTGEIEINAENVEILLPAASQLEFVEIEKDCSTFLETFLKGNPLNCLSYWSLAYFFSFDELKSLATQLICQHFSEIKNDKEFLSLSFDTLLELVCSNDLKVDKEEDVFTTVMNWINHDLKNRREHTIDLLKVIRYTHVDVPFLMSSVQDVFVSNGLKELFGEVMAVKCNSCFKLVLFPELCLSQRSIKTGQREMKMKALCWYDSRFDVYDCTDKNWNHVRSSEIPYGNVYAIVESEDSWIIFTSNYRTVFVDKLSSIVSSGPDLPPELHCSYSILTYGKQIFAIKRDVQKNSTDIFSYNLGAKHWTKVRTFQNQIWGACVTFTNDRIYYTADDDCSIICIDPKSNETESLSVRMCPDIIRKMIFYNGHLYAVGEKHIEKYEFSKKTWIWVSSYRASLQLQPSTTNRLMTVEYTQINRFQYTYKVDMFCFQTNQWVKHGNIKDNDSQLKFFFIFEQNADQNYERSPI